MINQLILAGAEYFSPASQTRQTDQGEPAESPTHTDIIIQNLLQGNMDVQQVPPDIYLNLLRTLEERISSTNGH